MRGRRTKPDGSRPGKRLSNVYKVMCAVFPVTTGLCYLKARCIQEYGLNVDHMKGWYTVRLRSIYTPATAPAAHLRLQRIITWHSLRSRDRKATNPRASFLPRSN